MKLEGKSKVNPMFQMSSLTDIIFLLLIFFMLTSTFVAPVAIKVKLPNASGQTLAKQSITVSITEDNEIYVDKNLVSVDELEAVVSAELAAIADVEDATVVLRADKATDHEFVVEVLKLGPKLDVTVILATQAED